MREFSRMPSTVVISRMRTSREEAGGSAAAHDVADAASNRIVQSNFIYFNQLWFRPNLFKPNRIAKN
jgi:hypothetical protein